jgi:hypothetical protein
MNQMNQILYQPAASSGHTSNAREHEGLVEEPSSPSDSFEQTSCSSWGGPKRKKIELADRGRIPRNIVEQFEAEAGR